MMLDLEGEARQESQGLLLDEGRKGVRFWLKPGPPQASAELALRSPGAPSAWEKTGKGLE